MSSLKTTFQSESLLGLIKFPANTKQADVIVVPEVK